MAVRLRIARHCRTITLLLHLALGNLRGFAISTPAAASLRLVPPSLNARGPFSGERERISENRRREDYQYKNQKAACPTPATRCLSHSSARDRAALRAGKRNRCVLQKHELRTLEKFLNLGTRFRAQARPPAQARARWVARRGDIKPRRCTTGVFHPKIISDLSGLPPHPRPFVQIWQFPDRYQAILILGPS